MLMDLLKERIDDIAKLISEIASGNFDYRIEHSNKDDELDAIIAGINMLGEELKTSTVSRNYMDSIYNGVVDLLFVLNTDYTIQSINPSATESLGFTTESVEGCSFFSLITNDKNNLLATSHLIRSTLEGENFIRNIELYINDEKGNTVPTTCSISNLYDTQKHRTGVLVIAKDITQIKKTEEELRSAKEKAEAANVAKSRFLANMSHEIRTPLNGILGIADIMMAEINDPNHLDYLNIIRTSGRNLTRLINDILDLSKIESGKLTLENIEFNFSEAIKSSLHPYKYLAEQKSLKFNYHLDDSIPTMVIGDPMRINQILVNLIGNSLKFTEEGVIDIYFKTLNHNKSTVTIQAVVTDTGIGIPKEKEDTIFQSFTQADDSFTRKYGGTGLGLTIVQNLVSQMNGTISFKSPANDQTKRGTTFTVELVLGIPASPEEVVPQTQIDVNNLKFESPLSILVVDDNDINMIVAEKLLTSLGAVVSKAENGQLAIDAVQERLEPFDLILMDIQMPVLDGYSATKILRNKGCTIPIIALSANVFNEHIKMSYDSGMNGHLQKPFTKKQIFDAINKCLHDVAKA